MDCTCSDCVSACERIPGVFTPLEALRAIRAGYALRIMSCEFHFPPSGGRMFWQMPTYSVLMPLALPRPSDAPRSNCIDAAWTHPMDQGHFRRDPMSASGRCTFLKRKRCEIHRSGFKPAECRAALICAPEQVRAPLRMTDAQRLGPWQTRVGELVISIWKRQLKRERRL